MNVLQVNGYESPGRRFNGLSITPLLREHGIISQHMVWFKDSDNPAVLTFDGQKTNNYSRKATLLGNRALNYITEKIERISSLQSLLYPHTLQLIQSKAFQEADLVHLHIIHSGFMSLLLLPQLTKLKPTIWTLHDPWAITGHCVHPFECERWTIGCGNCPSLETQKPLLFDTTRLLFKSKLSCYKKSKFDIIVASKWMRNMVERSPLMDGVRIHEVPFGLDLYFWNAAATPNARARFGIPKNALVIFFRANSTFKGLQYITLALQRIRSEQPIFLITTEDQGLSGKLPKKYKLIELGFTNDEQRLRDAMIAADMFLMPSVAEAFGMMAIEAMACGKPVISFDRTALPEITCAPDIGISVPMRDADALRAAIQRLIDNPFEREERGKSGRTYAEKHYSDALQAQRIAEIYRVVLGNNTNSR